MSRYLSRNGVGKPDRIRSHRTSGQVDERAPRVQAPPTEPPTAPRTARIHAMSMRGSVFLFNGPSRGTLSVSSPLRSRKSRVCRQPPRGVPQHLFPREMSPDNPGIIFLRYDSRVAGFSGPRAHHTASLMGYARVSTAEGRQVLDRQFDALNAPAASASSKITPPASRLSARTSPPASIPCAGARSSSSSISIASADAPANSSPLSTNSTSAASRSAPSTRPWTPRRRRDGPSRRSRPPSRRRRVTSPASACAKV